MCARVSWLDIDERPYRTRKYQSLILPTKDLPPNDMADDNSRGRGLKSSLKNERDTCVRGCVHMHTCTRAYDVRTELGVGTSDGGGRTEYNDCRQIAAPRSTCTRTTTGTAKP